jgi:alpha-D-xyloside xylohydrolase
MAEELHALNVHLMVSIWPNMTNDGPDQVEMQAHGYLLGNRSTYDAFNPLARALYWKQAYEGLFAYGVDAWWCDCTEPFEADWNGASRLEPEERLRINTEEAKRYLDAEYINAYSLLHAQGIYEGQRATTNEKRVVNLTRSAYTGQHRYGTITWSGDTAASWESLRRQIPAGLNFCATGEPYWTLDIGGFFVAKREQWFWDGQYDAGCDDLGYRELYVRWFQLGAFLPMFRPHGTDTPREVWRFGECGSMFYDALVGFVHLRYRLLPYIYSMAGWTTQTAYTMLRALPFDFRLDPNTYNIRDEFMFGPAFLVCPVTAPMYYAAGSQELKDPRRTRPVYLPAGCDWYDYWTNARHSGGQWIVADASLDRLPLYVRAGSIVPVGPPLQHAGEQTESLELRIYAGRDGNFDLYDDEGDNYNYERGAFEAIPLQWDDRRLVLTIGERRGTYPGMPRLRRFTVVVIEPGPASSSGKCRGSDICGEYDGSRLVLSLATAGT